MTDYTDLEIHLCPREAAGYPVTLRLGAEQEFPPGYLTAELLPWVPTGTPVADGKRLWAALLADPALRDAWQLAAGQAPRRRVRLWLDPAAPELHPLPWELLHDGQTFLAADAATPFSRYLPMAEPWGSPLAVRPLKMLAVVAHPQDLARYHLPPVDSAAERAALEAALGDLRPAHLQLDFLAPPVTLERLEEALRQGYHILHCVGHGDCNRAKQEAVLYWQDEAGNAALVPDARLGPLFRRLDAAARPRLVLLAACQSAARSTSDAFRGLGPALLAAGIPAVVAMQDAVMLETARRLTHTFYEQLVRQGLVDVALNAARATLLTAERPDAGVPVLFLRLKSGQLWEVAEEPVPTIHTAGGHVYEHVAAGTFIGRDQLIVISGYTGADLEQVLTRLQAVLATGRATLCADVPRERLTVTAPDGTRLELSAAAGTALGEIARQQADARADLTALLVNPRYGRWATQFVPLAGTLTTLEHPPGWIEVPPEFSLLENLGAGPQRQIRRTHLDDITQALAQYPALVLLGEPGSGKTTTLYKLALEAAQQRLATGTGRLPLYLSLADYREPVAPYTFVESRLRQQVGAEAGELLRHGELLLLCDALNEMPFAHDREYREKVGAWQRFVSECPGHQILFSCRSRDYSEPLGLHQVEIERLDDARVQEFLEKYGVGAAWERLRGTPLLALVRNPYYLQMLAYLVASRGTWPENRAALFQGFVAALLERERQRQPPDWPGAAALEAALAVLAEQLQPLGEGTRRPRSQALAWLPAEPEPAVVLRLGLAATLLDCERVPEGEEQVRFYHHQLQDYFAARALLTRLRAREDVTARWRQPMGVQEMPDPGPLGDYEPLPPPPTTGWEEPTVLAAGLAPDPAAFVAAVRQGCLLAQFTAEKLPGMDWGGGGLIDYWIRTADLAAARFDRVHAQRVTT